jgi:hypothetical protein
MARSLWSMEAFKPRISSSTNVWSLARRSPRLHVVSRAIKILLCVYLHAVPAQEFGELRKEAVVLILRSQYVFLIT